METGEGVTVWIVEHGCYGDRGISGVYASLEAAIADNPPRREASSSPNERPGGWMPNGEGWWWNGLDLSDSAEAWPEVVRAAPVDTPSLDRVSSASD